MAENLMMLATIPMYAWCVAGWAAVLVLYVPYFVVEECIDTWRYVRA